jgi:hypothetical protein
MSRFWFSYCDHSGSLLAGLIVDSPNPLQAQNCAAAECADAGARYCEGYELDQQTANLIPAAAIGRMLNRQEVLELIRELETRVIPKRAAAASVARRGSVRTPHKTAQAGTR